MNSTRTMTTDRAVSDADPRDLARAPRKRSKWALDAVGGAA